MRIFEMKFSHALKHFYGRITNMSEYGIVYAQLNRIEKISKSTRKSGMEYISNLSMRFSHVFMHFSIDYILASAYVLR